MALIEVIDLPQSVRDAFELEELQGIIAGLNAKAERVAPCLTAVDSVPTQGQLAEAKLILLGTLKRWAEAGAGALTQRTQTAGPFNQSESYDTRQRTGYNLWPSEIADLQAICASGSDSSSAFTVDTAPGSAVIGNHSVTCNLVFGGLWCSCGAILTGGAGPLYRSETLP